jgi:Magnesium chelatase, subunit ChlI C-terminal
VSNHALLTLAVLAITAGCWTEPHDQAFAAAGTYNMVAANNGPLPYTSMSNAAGPVEVLGGKMTLRSDRSYMKTNVLRTTFGAMPETDATVENGTFSIDAGETTFSIPPSHGRPGFSYTGAISGNVVSYTYNGASYRSAARSLLHRAAEGLELSARGYHRTLKVARTIADLDGSDSVAEVHVAEALRYRRARS